MKLNGKNGLLNNRYLLYAVFFVAVASLFSYVQSRNHTALLFFLLVALGVNYFNKNMIVVLGSSIVLTNFLASYTTIFSKVRLLEGLVEGHEEDEEDEEDDDEGDKDDKVKAGFANKESFVGKEGNCSAAAKKKQQ